jgi:multicomponent Na+:H+ antiporter subunit C
MFANLPYYTVVALTIIGFATVLLKRNLVKMTMGLNILTAAVNLLIIVLGFRAGGIAPIYTMAPQTEMVLPTPQALVLTSIVIGVATTALLLSFTMVIYRKYGTVNVDKIRELRE